MCHDKQESKPPESISASSQHSGIKSRKMKPTALGVAIVSVIVIILAGVLFFFRNQLLASYHLASKSTTFEKADLSHAIAAVTLYDGEMMSLNRKSHIALVNEDGTFQLLKTMRMDMQIPEWNTQGLYFSSPKYNYFLSNNGKVHAKVPVKNVNFQSFSVTLDHDGVVGVYDKGIARNGATSYQLAYHNANNKTMQEMLHLQGMPFIDGCASCNNYVYAIGKSSSGNDAILYRIFDGKHVVSKKVSQHSIKEIVGDEYYQGRSNTNASTIHVHGLPCDGDTLSFLYNYAPDIPRKDTMAISHHDTKDYGTIFQYYFVRWNTKTGALTSVPLRNSEGNVLYGPSTVDYSLGNYISHKSYNPSQAYIIDRENGRILVLDTTTGIIKQLVNKTTC